jgi:YidC/Oxa1 family membrane protein insertase
MESTMSIQALKPRMDELKAKYESDPETLQLETARLYKAAGVNPLAGCLPTLATIPVFIGLYRYRQFAAACRFDCLIRIDCCVDYAVEGC